MLKTKRGLVVFIVSVVVLLLLLTLGLKLRGAWLAQPRAKDWNESGKCYIATYIPEYRSMGLVGRVFELFSSKNFYRVYTKEEEMLRTSEWYLWMREGSENIAPEFNGASALYPGAEGWEGWTVTECR